MDQLCNEKQDSANIAEHISEISGDGNATLENQGMINGGNHDSGNREPDDSVNDEQKAVNNDGHDSESDSDSSNGAQNVCQTQEDVSESANGNSKHYSAEYPGISSTLAKVTGEEIEQTREMEQIPQTADEKERVSEELHAQNPVVDIDHQIQDEQTPKADLKPELADNQSDVERASSSGTELHARSEALDSTQVINDPELLTLSRSTHNEQTPDADMDQKPVVAVEQRENEVKEMIEMQNANRMLDITQEASEQPDLPTPRETINDNETPEIINAESVEKENDSMDVLGNGLLRRKVVRQGKGLTTRPVRENEVVVKYVAKLHEKSEGPSLIVDQNERFTLVLGDQESLEVFDLIILLMQEGEVCEVVSDSRYAYGNDGKAPLVPPNATVEFEIELLEVRDGPYSSGIASDKRMSWADGKRQQGNDLYVDGRSVEAVAAYMKACKALEKGVFAIEADDPARLQIDELRLKCYNNLAAAQMKLSRWQDALKSCNAAEKLGPRHVKTLYRKGVIYCELGELEKGLRFLKQAQAIEPQNQVIGVACSKWLKAYQTQTENQKKMYRRMLGTAETKEKPKPRLTKHWNLILGGTLAVGVVLAGIYAAQRL